MKSKFFKDTHELESAFDACAPDKMSICLRLNKQAYERMIAQAQRLGLSSGEYMERLLSREEEMEHRLH
ncbi:MAG: hypothetical protein GXY67_08590 [Clostridiales bacterium]|nr:hypothetical protein [Clostridiales bacterium]